MYSWVTLTALAAAAAPAAADITHWWHPVDDRLVPGSDPLAPCFNDGNYCTFDLGVTVFGDDRLTSIAATAQLSDPADTFWNEETMGGAGDPWGHPLGDNVPQPELFGPYPALEYDCFWTTPDCFPNAECGPLGFIPGQEQDRLLSARWTYAGERRDGEYVLARYTVRHLAAAPTIMHVEGATTVESGGGAPHPFDFDLVLPGLPLVYDTLELVLGGAYSAQPEWWDDQCDIQVADDFYLPACRRISEVHAAYLNFLGNGYPPAGGAYLAFFADDGGRPAEQPVWEDIVPVTTSGFIDTVYGLSGTILHATGLDVRLPAPRPGGAMWWVVLQPHDETPGHDWYYIVEVGEPVLFNPKHWRDGPHTPPCGEQETWLAVKATVALTVRAEELCRGDIDGDCDVDQSDLGLMLGHWGCQQGCCPGDLNRDGRVDQADLGRLLSDWGCAP